MLDENTAKEKPNLIYSVIDEKFVTHHVRYISDLQIQNGLLIISTANVVGMYNVSRNQWSYFFSSATVNQSNF